ncbi:hypothetical protein protein [Bacillus cereus G9241]|nr:hypothetical protein protein [Bacillus cereus G9241]
MFTFSVATLIISSDFSTSNFFISSCDSNCCTSISDAFNASAGRPAFLSFCNFCFAVSICFWNNVTSFCAIFFCISASVTPCFAVGSLYLNRSCPFFTSSPFFTANSYVPFVGSNEIVSMPFGITSPPNFCAFSICFSVTLYPLYAIATSEPPPANAKYDPAAIPIATTLVINTLFFFFIYLSPFRSF